MDGAVSASNSAPASTELKCSTCRADFDTKDSRRNHMRCDWHIYNIKRKIASLDPISELIFFEKVLNGESEGEGVENARPRQDKQTNKEIIDSRKGRNIDRRLSNSISMAAEAGFSPETCLFCSTSSLSLTDNLLHMSRLHSFFIPNLENLIDVASFLRYLHTVISELHECIFCGSERGSKAGAQDHMKGKGHCRLQFGDTDGDWLGLEEFYEIDDNSGGEEERASRRTSILDGNDDEKQLPSGRTVNSRRVRPERKRIPIPNPSQQLLMGDDSEGDGSTPYPADWRLAMRKGTTTSLVGVSEHQQRALMATEKHIQVVESRKRLEYERKVEKGGNKQKHYRVLTMGKKAGGLEKRNG